MNTNTETGNIKGINGQLWLREIESDKCNTGQLVRVSSYLNNTCYNTYGGASIKFTFNTSADIKRITYEFVNCVGEGSMVGFNWNGCYQFGSTYNSYNWSSTPPIEAPGFSALERVSSTFGQDCGDYNSNRNIIKLNTCSKLNMVFNAFIISGDENGVQGTTFTYQCPISGVSSIPRCGPSGDEYATAIVTPTIQWTVPPISVISDSQIQLLPFSVNYKYIYRYSISYLVEPSTYVIAPGCASVLPSEGCLINITNPTANTKVKIQMLGDPILINQLGLSIPEYQSNLIKLPAFPKMTSLTITQYGTTWVTFSYSGSLATSYKVTVGGTPVNSCSTTTTCTVNALTPGSSVQIVVSAVNPDGESPSLTDSIVLYNSMGIPVIETVEPSQYQVVVTYSSTGGIPSQTKYTVKSNGNPISNCVNILATTCTISGLPQFFTTIISVDATNDNLNKSVSTQVVYEIPVVKSILTIPKTTSVLLSYKVEPLPISYTIYLNDVVQPHCSQSEACIVDSLAPGIHYNVTVTATDIAGTSAPYTVTGDLYPLVSKPIITNTPSSGQYMVQFSSTGGVPNESVYTVKRDNIVVCNEIKDTTCTVTGLDPLYVSNVSVSVTNDGYTAENWTLVTFIPPTVDKLEVVSRKTQSILISYSATPLNPVSNFQVLVNGTSHLECIPSSTSCTIIGLLPNTIYEITVIATNDAGTSPAKISSSTYGYVSEPTIVSATPSSGKIDLTYSTTGGVPGATLYTIKKDNVNVQGCINIAATTCTITGLNPTFTTNVTVIAINDGYTTQSWTNVVFLAPVMNAINVTSVRTTSITFTYSATGSPTSYSVMVNNLQRTNCNSLTECTVSGFTPGTSYGIVVTATNAAGTSEQATANGVLYRAVGIPTIVTKPSPNQIVVQYSANDGVPKESLYTTKINGTNVNGCVSIPELKCIITQLTSTFTYVVSVEVENDGAKKSDSINVIFEVPSNPNVTIELKTTMLVRFKYVASRNPTSFNILFNNIEIPNCSLSGQCSIENLRAGSAYNITITATNAAGVSEPTTLTGNLYEAVSVPTISATPSPNQISVSYSSTGGVPGATLYTVMSDNVVVSNCNSIPSLQCTISGLQSQFIHNITVIATNDYFSNQNTTEVIYMPPLMNTIQTSKRTKSISFSYSALYSASSYTVIFNSVEQTQCSLTNSCTIDSLPAGSQYTISITGTNAVGTSAIPAASSGSLYETINNPVIVTKPSNGQIIVEYSTTGGVPAETNYTTKLDGVDVIGCVSITEQRCTITGLEEQYKHKVIVVASNDGDTKQSNTDVEYLGPIMSQIQINSVRTKSISFTYSALNSPTSFNVLFNGVVQSQCSTNTTCSLSNLPAGLAYNISISASNEAGTSTPVESIGNLYQPITKPSVTLKPSANKIVVDYSTNYGVPTETLYTVQLDGQNQQDCTNITGLQCTISGLQEEYTHTIVVIAANDGAQTQTTQNVEFYTPEMNPIQVTKRTKSIIFSYSALFSPSSFNVLFNGISQTQCSSTINCTLDGLVDGSAFNISISATNDAGTSAPIEVTGNLYKSLSTPAIETTPSPNQIIVDYSSTDGVPSETKYTVKIDNVNYQGCVDITELRCTITGLQAQFTHNIVVVATNDGDSKQSSTDVVYLAPTMNAIVIDEIRTTSISFNYSASPVPSKYIVYVNTVLHTECENSTSCKISNIDAGSEVNITILATNYVGTSDQPAQITKQLYQAVSAPTVNVTPKYNRIMLDYQSTGGVPSETLYTVQMDSVNVVGCIDIKTLKCDIINLTPLYSHNITVIAANDGYTQQSTEFNVSFTGYPPLSGSQFTNVEATQTTINATWTHSTGGEPRLTFYDLSISIDNTTWVVACEDIQVTSCIINSLTPNTFYYLNLTVKNIDQESTNSYNSIKTADVPAENNCQCGSNGYCDKVTSLCVCNQGWIGPKCDIKYQKPTDNNPPIINPKPNNPEVTIGDGDEFTFKLNKIVEKTKDLVAVYTLELTNLTWTLTQNLQQTVVHPTTGMNVSMNQWNYSTSVENKTNLLSIQFTQILPLGNAQVPDFPMEFAGEKFNLTIGALKYKINIQKWNFESKENVLEIQSTFNSTYDDCYELPAMATTNSSQVSTFIIQQTNGNYIYGRVSRRVLLDQIPRMSDVRITRVDNSTTLLSTVVPYFDQQLVIDPDVTVINNAEKPVLKESCKKSGSSKNNNWRIIVGSVVGAVGFVAVAGVSAYFIKKHLQSKRTNDRLSNKLRNLDRRV